MSIEPKHSIGSSPNNFCPIFHGSDCHWEYLPHSLMLKVPPVPKYRGNGSVMLFSERPDH